MIKKLLCVGITAIALSAAAQAETYRVELDAVGAKINLDLDGIDDTTLWGARALYHFKAVDTTARPYAEAAFLAKSSNIWATHFRADEDFYDVETTAIGAEFFLLGGLFYVAGDAQRASVNTNINVSANDDNNTNLDDDDTTWSATVGITPIDGLLITTTYNEDVDYELNLAAKYVTALGGNQFIGLTASYYDDEDEDYYGIGADYYFNQRTSVGVGVDYDGEDSDPSIRAKHFFSPAFFVGASYIDSNYADVYSIEAGLRF